ncbi:phosphoribosylaminoimidazolesuccinocarboxamide synthase [Flavobacterium sp. ST-75]|uniref:Phosphoribosylaminoimidazolesuccinocarboxamide synthase n=1 Tax=Flavobacterium rhizophilum TaxID=3163296 RepID=A0ABW8YEY5_9FLAO
MDKKFKTKTGYCHVLPDNIVLTRDGVLGEISKIAVGNTMTRSMIIYSLFLVYLIYKVVTLYAIGDMVRAIFHLAVAVLLFFALLKRVNNSATPVIPRNKIKAVTFKKATALTRAYFLIDFEDEKGKLKKRIIMLPGSMSGGYEAAEGAVKIMQEEKLIA